MVDENVGLRCPECGMYGDSYTLRIRNSGYFTLLGHGTTQVDPIPDWDETSHCICGECDYEATVADFCPKSIAQMLLDVAEMVVASHDACNKRWRAAGDATTQAGKDAEYDEWEDYLSAAMKAIAAAKERGLDG